MVEISDKLFKKVALKFPCMNVIKGDEEDSLKGILQEREIDNYMVTVAIGTSNVYIISVIEKLE